MENEIRVLHLLTAIIPNGGVQSLILRYARQARLHGVVFDYVAQLPGDPELERQCRDSGSQIYSVPEMTKHPIGFLRSLGRLLRQHPEYRIFHVHQNFLNFLPLWAAKRAGVPVRISHSHSTYSTSAIKQQVRRILRRLVLHSATELWACSQDAYQWLYGETYQDTAHRYILHNAVDSKQFRFRPERREALRIQQGLGDTFLCICVGTMSALKNQTFLLDVWKYLASKQSGRPFQLWLVGDGQTRESLETKVSALGLHETVSFLGIRKDVPDLLCQADCLLLPSLAEGLPVCAVEAQASGLPAIVSEYVPREVAFTDAVTFLPLDVTLWADHLLTLSEQEVVRTSEIDPACGYCMERESLRLVQQYRRLLGKETS